MCPLSAKHGYYISPLCTVTGRHGMNIQHTVEGRKRSFHPFAQNLSIQAPANSTHSWGTAGLLDGDFLYKIPALAKPLQPLKDDTKNQCSA